MKLRRRDAPQNWAACLNVAAIVLTAHANVPPDRAAQVIGMLLGVPVSAGWVDNAAARLSVRLEEAGFDAAAAASKPGGKRKPGAGLRPLSSFTGGERTARPR